MKQRFKYFNIILLLCLSSGILKGQDKSSDTLNTGLILEKLFNRLVNNYDDADRIHINDSINLIINGYVRSDSIFTHKFTNLTHLGQIMSPDSLIKIVTWNLVLGNSPGKYYCYFIKKGAKGEKNKVYNLASTYREEAVKTDTTYSESDWYGALYYDLKPVDAGNERCWVLLGIDYGNPLVSKKIIDVLRFASDGSLFFGRKWFEADQKISYRAVFEYAANGMMTLRFVSAKSIVFDHLVPISSNHKDDRQYYGPDYSYDAYNFVDGMWKLSVNVDARNNQ